MIKFIKKYKHGLVIAIYAILYLIAFNYLENRTVYSYRYHVIDTVFDSYIPFCEYFIVPYLLWFPYMIMTIWYFIFKNNNKKEANNISYKNHHNHRNHPARNNSPIRRCKRR